MELKTTQYVNITDFFEDGIYFYWFVGGRNTGKTYSTLDYIAHSDEKFIYIRKSKVELEIGIKSNIFSKLISDGKTSGWECIYNEKLSVIKHNDKLMGYGTSISTCDNVTGADFSSFDIIFYDEFINKKGQRNIVRDEYDTLMRMYETVARNRELEGKEPVRLIGCSNSNSINNDIFKGLGIVTIIEKALIEGHNIITNYERGFKVVILETPKELAEKRKETAIMKLTKGTNYYNMSLNNEFSYDDFTNCKKINIKGFKPLINIDNWFIWKKKGETMYYCSFDYFKTKDRYNTEIDIESINLIRKYCYLWNYYLKNQVRFESFEIKQKFIDIFG